MRIDPLDKILYPYPIIDSVSNFKYKVWLNGISVSFGLGFIVDSRFSVPLPSLTMGYIKRDKTFDSIDSQYVPEQKERR